MELNKEIKLPTGKFDVAGMLRTQRIIFFEDERKIIVKSSEKAAIHEILEKYSLCKVEILTPSQANRRYPKVFTNSSVKQFCGDTRTVIIKVPAEMHTFLCRQGQITAYLQSLIKEQMQKVCAKV